MRMDKVLSELHIIKLYSRVQDCINVRWGLATVPIFLFTD